VETGRVEAFSDGVFAIAITLLILAVGVDQARASGNLSHQLLHLWPAYIAYIVSFVTVGIMWINHHDLFRHFAGADRILLLLNTLLLMSISFTPFSTRVVAEFAHTDSDRRAAALLYGINFTVTAILFFSLWMYGSRRLLRPDADRREVSGITRSYLPGAPLYATATLLAFASPIASLIMFAAIALFYAISSAVFGRSEDTVARTASVGDPST
jgi:TMEM175 potassium channel family protein